MKIPWKMTQITDDVYGVVLCGDPYPAYYEQWSIPLTLENSVHLNMDTPRAYMRLKKLCIGHKRGRLVHCVNQFAYILNKYMQLQSFLQKMKLNY